MSNVKPVKRRYSDTEVAALLSKAVELQESGAEGLGGFGGDPGGLTLEDIRQVAAEAGIDPAFVDQAATLATMGPPAPLRQEERWYVGAPHAWRLHASVSGEVPEEQLPLLVDSIRAVLGPKGEVQPLYGRVEWSHDDGLGPIIVGITSRGGVTDVDVSARRGGEAAIWHGLLVPLVGLIGGGLAGGAIAPGIGVAVGMVAITGFLHLAARAVWGSVSRGWERRLGQVLERVTDQARRVARMGEKDGPEDGEKGLPVPGGSGAASP